MDQSDQELIVIAYERLVSRLKQAPGKMFIARGGHLLHALVGPQERLLTLSAPEGTNFNEMAIQEIEWRILSFLAS